MGAALQTFLHFCPGESMPRFKKSIIVEGWDNIHQRKERGATRRHSGFPIMDGNVMNGFIFNFTQQQLFAEDCPHL